MKSFKNMFLLIFIFILITVFSGLVNASGDLFKKYVVKGEETLKGFAKQNLEDVALLPELLKFNNINVIDFDLSRAKFSDIGLTDGDIILIPSADVLKSIKKAKTDADKNELVRKFKKFRYEGIYLKIGELKDKLKEGEISVRVDRESQKK